jgi:hypothetical protein
VNEEDAERNRATPEEGEEDGSSKHARIPSSSSSSSTS